MTITLHFDDDIPNLLLFTMKENTTWDEYHAAIARGVQLIEKQDEVVDVLVINHTGPPEGNVFPGILRLDRTIFHHPKIGLIVTVFPPERFRLLRGTVEVVERLFGNISLPTFDNVDKAKQFIKARRP